ncbi:SDR family oxidoreductase [Diaminobutyricimonas sp. TR449]|uniref:SDR family oxidoreductase n=1 Tax=Diaminobutyricimonas sp. TR449 TaxID=2708076 RepID=UPI00142112D7|nr:SDR family oxidoreductase [Diaminobutyricimonas sp. TR449]
MDLGLGGKTALVLGSTSGLGLAVARALSSEGARVALTGRRGDEAERLAAELPGAVGLQCDLTQPDSAERLVKETTQALGEIDILILNAGGPPPGRADELDSPAVRAAIDTLLIRQLEFVSLVLPTMKATGWGRIVGLGSSGVQQPLANLALSNLSRAGLAGYLKTLASEVAVDGVTVNMVLPGRIATDRVASLDRGKAERESLDIATVQERSRATIPAGRYGLPDEFGAVVAFVCSAQASYVTGEQIRCDGGLVSAF